MADDTLRLRATVTYEFSGPLAKLKAALQQTASSDTAGFLSQRHYPGAHPVTCLLALLSALVALTGPAAAFNPADYGSPTYNAPNVDKLIIQGLGSKGDASQFSVRPRDDAPEVSLRRLMMSGCVPIELFGGVADGTTDTLPAVQRAMATAATGTGICTEFGAGTYAFSAPWSFEAPASQTYPNRAPYAFSVRGAGAGATVLKFASTNGLALTLHGQKQSVHLSGLKFLSTTPGGGSGVKITQTECLLSFVKSTFDDLSFDGADPRSAAEGGPEHRWNIGAEIIGLSGTSWTGITAFGDNTWTRGTGISLKGNTSGSCPTAANGYRFWHSIYHDFSYIALKQLNIGLLLDDYVQGVTITGANFQNGNYGIFQPANMQAPDNVQLNVTNSQFQLAVANVKINTNFSILQFSNNTFLMGENPGIVGLDIKTTGAQKTNLATITGNMFNTVVPNTGGGIGIQFHGAASTIGANTFSGLTTGVNLLAGAQTNTVIGNTFNAFGSGQTPYINNGSNNVLPTVNTAAQKNVTTCSPTGYFIPHGLPGTPLLERVQATVSVPTTGAANLSNPTVMVTGADATSVTVVFACGTLATAGSILFNIASSLSR